MMSQDNNAELRDLEEEQAGAIEISDEKKDDDVQERSKGRLVVILFSLALATFLAALDNTIITTALPTITAHFDSDSGYVWIGSAFQLANAASVPLWGKTSDIFGRKPVLIFANVVFMVGSLVAGLSTSIGMLIAGRAVQGLGAGGLVNLVNIVIGDLFSLRRRGAFYGMIGAVWAVASAIGPVIGGAFTQNASWRWCFYVNLPLDGIAVVALFIFLDVKTPSTPLLEGLKAIDWIGSLSIVGATLMFLFGLQYGGVTDPWSSPTVICLIVFGVVTFVIFGIWEHRYAQYPVIPSRITSKLTNKATLAVVFTHGFGFMGAPYYLPLYFQTIRGVDPIISGVYLLPTAVVLALASMATGIFIRKVGIYLPPLYFGMTLLTVGYGLFVDFTSTSSLAKLMCFQVIVGLGAGPVFQSPIIALHAHIDPRDLGTGTATIGFVRQIATTVSIVIGDVVIQNEMKKKIPALTPALGSRLARELGTASVGDSRRLIDALPDMQRTVARKYFAQSMQTTWIVYACVAGAGLLCTFLVRGKPLDTKHEETKTGLETERANAADHRAGRKTEQIDS